MARRQSKPTYLMNPDVTVFASGQDDIGVALIFGRYRGSGCYETWLTPAKAREIAEGLIRAADHYDAETARLAAESQKVAA